MARGIHDVSELPPGGQRFADILQAWVQQGQVLPRGLRQAAMDLCLQLQRGRSPSRGATSRRAGDLRYKLAVHVLLAGDRAMAEQVVAVSCGWLLDCILVVPGSSSWHAYSAGGELGHGRAGRGGGLQRLAA